MGPRRVQGWVLLKVVYLLPDPRSQIPAPGVIKDLGYPPRADVLLPCRLQLQLAPFLEFL